jgi:hypothetical protein
MYRARRGFLERAQRIRSAPFGKTLECFASGLHQHYDQSDNRMAEEKSSYDGKGRDEIGREVPADHTLGRRREYWSGSNEKAESPDALTPHRTIRQQGGECSESSEGKDGNRDLIAHDR